jgi:large subunit ribosomal protein L21e
MVKASKGIMEKSRQKFKRRARERGLSPITRALRTFEVGEKAVIVIDSSLQTGWPHHRFHGLTGTVVEKRGRAYVIDVRFGGKVKQAIVLPEHLKRA